MNSVREVFWPGKASVLLISIAGFIGVMLAVSTSANSWQLSIIAASMTTAYTALALLLAITLRTRIAASPKFSLPISTLVLIAVGSSRGWVFYEIGVILDLNERAGLDTRVINSTLTILIWGLIFISIESRMNWFRDKFRENFSQQALQLAKSTELSSSEIARTIDNMQDIQALQANLRGIAQEAKTSQLSSAQLLTAASKIRQEIEVWLRPLSNRIWFDSTQGLPKFRIWELLKESLRGLRINWWLTSTISGCTFYLGALSVLGFGDATIRAVSFVATFTILLMLLSKLRQRVASTITVGVIVLVAIAVISNLVGDIVTFLLLGVTAFSGNILLPLFGPLTSFGVLWIAALLGQIKVDWAELEKLLARSSSQPETEILKSRLAGFLHNSVQSELSGIALAFERTDPSENADIKRLVSRLEAIATKSIGSEFATVTLAPGIRLNKVIESWQGIADVRCDLTDEISNHLKLPLAVELIEEAISNAVRHAGAKQITIIISELGEDLQVVVTHPARVNSKGKARLGFLWLERYSKQHRVDFNAAGERRLTVLL